MTVSAKTTRFTEPNVRRTAEDSTLQAETVRWLAALPAGIRPRQLPVRFVRIANELARRWNSNSTCRSYFDDLLIDKRGDRSGFPIQVMLELATLKYHFETVLHPSPQTVWDEIAGGSLRPAR